MVYAIILFALVVTAIGAIRARNIPLRRIDAYTAMAEHVSEAVETGKTFHVSFGSSAIRDTSTISAIATSALLYNLTARAALADRPVIATLSDPVTLSLAQDTLRKAYKARDQLPRYQSTLARWYPQGPQSLAFAAGVGVTILDENVSSNVMAGRFGPELMLAAENAIRYDRHLIAQSDQIDGQAVAFAVSNVPLIGEELYAGGGYIGRTPSQIGGVVAMDVLRYVVIAVMIGMAILSFLGTRF